MRTKITLLLVCLALNAGAWRNELYLLGGAGKSYKASTLNFSGNFGMGTSTDNNYFYFNLGVGLYYLNGDYPVTTPFFVPGGNEEGSYIAEFAAGGGFRYQQGNVTFKAGPDLGLNFSLNTADLYVSLVPKMSLTFNLGVVDLGIMGKGSVPVSAPGAYSPQFWGGGLLLRF